jgi:hypothetical protein
VVRAERRAGRALHVRRHSDRVGARDAERSEDEHAHEEEAVLHRETIA